MIDRIARLLLVLAFAFATVAMFTGCEEKSEIEEAGDAIGDAADDAAEKAEEAAEGAADALNDAAN